MAEAAVGAEGVPVSSTALWLEYVSDGVVEVSYGIGCDDFSGCVVDVEE